MKCLAIAGAVVSATMLSACCHAAAESTPDSSCTSPKKTSCCGKCSQDPKKCGEMDKVMNEVCPFFTEVWELDFDSVPAAKNVKKPEHPVTLKVEKNGKFHGSTGTNRYFGKAKVHPAKKKVEFGSAGKTLMAGPAVEFEDIYMQQLGDVEEFDIIDGVLVLSKDGKPVMKFKKQAKPAAAPKTDATPKAAPAPANNMQKNGMMGGSGMM